MYAIVFFLNKGYFRALTIFSLLLYAASLSADTDIINGDNGKGRKITVNCDQGDELAYVVNQAWPGDMIVVSGTCTGKVTIRTDRISIDGQGETIIEGNNASTCDLGPLNEADEGLIDIDSVQGVVLAGLTVQNSPVDGIFLRNTAAATIRDTTVKNSCDDGIDSEKSVVIVENSVFEYNGENGINLFNNSAMSVAPGTVTLNDNGQFGLQNQFSFAGIDGGATLEVRRNVLIGVAVFSAGRLVPFTGSTLVVSNNGGNGVLLLDGGIDASFATLEIDGNGTNSQEDSSGMTLVDGSVFTQNGGTLDVQGNQPLGVAVENSTMSLRRLEEDGTFTIQNNVGLDLVLRFGARATLTGTIPTIVCDGTVLSQGDVTCPTVPPDTRAPAVAPLSVPPER